MNGDDCDEEDENNDDDDEEDENNDDCDEKDENNDDCDEKDENNDKSEASQSATQSPKPRQWSLWCLVCTAARLIVFSATFFS